MVATERPRPRPVLERTLGNSSGNLREILPGGHDRRRMITVLPGRILSEPQMATAEQKPRLLSVILEGGLLQTSALGDEDIESLRRSAQVLEGMDDLDDDSRLRLFIFGAWEHNPNILYLAASLVGIPRLRADDLISEALRDKRHKYQITRFNYLRKPNVLEVRDLRRARLKNPAIARKLELPLPQEKIIVQDLLLLEEIEPDPQGAKQAQRFKELCDSIEHYEEARLTIDELASLLNETPRMVRYARKRLIAVGRIERKTKA